MAGLVAVTAVALAAAFVLRPAPEVVTADGATAPDGSGRTSTHRAGDDLVPAWRVEAWPPFDPTALLVGATDLGDLFVVSTSAETVGLMHPRRLAERRSRRSGDDPGPREPVRWRLPAIQGTPAPLGGRLPVVADAELLWLDVGDGTIAERHPLASTGADARGPAFAVPAGDALLTLDGSTSLSSEGDVRWSRSEGGEVVGVVRELAVVLAGRSLEGRSLGDGAARWTYEVASEGKVDAALVDDVVVATARGGRIAVLDPATGHVLAGGRVGPVPSRGRPWDGETTIVGTSDRDVFVRVDRTVGIRYARVPARSIEAVEMLNTLADRDVRELAEHDDGLLTLLWDGVEVSRDGAVGWSLTVLEQPPSAVSGWVVFGGDELTVTRVAGDDGPLEFPHAPHVPDARPAVLDDMAVLISRQAQLEARDLRTGEVAWSTEFAGTCCPSHFVTGDRVVVAGPPPTLLARDGTAVWRGPAPVASGTNAEAVAVAGDWFVVARDDGSSGGTVGLRRLSDGRTGPELDTGPLRDVVSDGRRLHGLTAPGPGGSRLVTYDLPERDTTARRLSPRWDRPLGADVQLVTTGEELLLVGAASVQHLDPATGAVRRRTALPRLGLSPAAVAEDRLVRRADAHTIEAIDLGGGSSWTRRFELPIATAPTIAGDVVYVSDVGSVVSGLSLLDGTTVTSVEVREPGVSALTVADGHLLVAGHLSVAVLGPEREGTP